jgi:hypothetical protein
MEKEFKVPYLSPNVRFDAKQKRELDGRKNRGFLKVEAIGRGENSILTAPPQPERGGQQKQQLCLDLITAILLMAAARPKLQISNRVSRKSVSKSGKA